MTYDRNIPRFSSFTVKHASATAQRGKEDNGLVGTRPHKIQKQVTPRSSSVKQVKQLAQEDGSNSSFFIDNKGDKLNLSYGSVHQYSVPKYYRAGRQRVLGLSSNQVINNAQSSTKDLVINKIESKDRVAFQSATTGNVKRLKLSKRNFLENIVERVDFLPFTTHVSSKESGVPDESSDDSGSSVGEDHFQSWQNKQNLKISRQVEREPQNVDAWLVFIEWQTDYNPNAGRTAISDLRQAVCEKALMQNPGNKRLLIRLLKEKSFTLDADELAAEWMDVLRRYPGNFEIWNEYLSFQQTDLASFSLIKTLRTFKHCFDILRDSLLATVSSAMEPIEQNLVYILCRYVYVLTESGYNELAVACMQAIVEFVFFAPRNDLIFSSSSDFEKEVDNFGRFWESECPRFGENNAMGWTKWIDNPHQKRVKQNVLSKVIILDDWNNWSKVEGAAEQRHHHPARLYESSKELREDFDPFRLPVFSDIKHVLFRLASSKAKAALISIALDFLGDTAKECLHVLPVEWKSDQYLTSRLAPTDCNWLWPDPEVSNDVRLMPQYISTSTTQLKDYSIFPCLVNDTDNNSLPICTTDSCEASRNHLQEGMKGSVEHLVAVCEDESTSLVILTYAWAHFGEWSLSLAHDLSKRYCNSVFLSNAYAKLLWYNNQECSARTAFRTVIDTLKNRNEQGNIVFIWKLWAELELFYSSRDAVLAVLFEMNNIQQAEDESKIGPRISRCRRQLHSGFQTNLASHKVERAIAYCQCLFLLEYVVDLNGALAFADSVNKQFTVAELNRSQCFESFTQFVAQVLTWHAKTQQMYQQSALRDFLENAIHCFPRNSLLLSAYAWNEATVRIENRTRNLLYHKVLSPSVSNSISWLHAIYIEFRLSGNGQYNVNAIRNLFERASMDEKSMHSIVLWRLYIRYEFRQGLVDAAKRLLFRALQACPWAKEIYMLAFTDFSQAMTLGEMRMIYSVMMEKDLRLFADIIEH